MLVKPGDSYAGSGKGAWDNKDGGQKEVYIPEPDGRAASIPKVPDGLKPKDLVGIPWMVAKALQEPYYLGRIMAETDRVRLATMIDAEGTICGFTHERRDTGKIRHGIHIHITNSNTRLLDECFRIWPTTREDHNHHSEGHLGDLPTWRWIAHGIDEKSALLCELYPYLIGKKKQALLAWNFLQISKNTRGRNKGQDGERNRERYRWIVDALSRLNHLEHVDVPSWCEEPPVLYEQGWWLRQDIIWAKPNPMPESVRDRCTKSHEYIFILTKSAKYYFDPDAIAEPFTTEPPKKLRDVKKEAYATSGRLTPLGGEPRTGYSGRGTKNKRDVWTVPSSPYKEAHFATFPQKLVEPCILAGCPLGGTVLDPFSGAGTTGLVALKYGRNYRGIELNPEYVEMSKRRIQKEIPLMAQDFQLMEKEG